ncbi:uncharacterized protein LOC129054918 [Pongo abelii]|uniref:uncharacterized protein LOC129054918 n=1 Tax=Pongo abelii TaxID=9601 RepID=UPI0030065797
MDQGTCALEIVSPLPENKAEVNGVPEQSIQTPETWNGEGRTQPLDAYQRGKTWYLCQLFSPSPPPSLFSFYSPNCCQPASAPNCHLLELSVEQSQRAVRCDAGLCRLRSTACGKSAGWRRKIKRNREQGSAAIGVCKRRGGREREISTFAAIVLAHRLYSFTRHTPLLCTSSNPSLLWQTDGVSAMEKALGSTPSWAQLQKPTQNGILLRDPDPSPSSWKTSTKEERAGFGFPPSSPPPPPPPGRAGLGSSEPSGGLGTGPRSSEPPQCVAGCGFIILIDSSCSPTPWGPRTRKAGGGGICRPLPRPSPPAAPQATLLWLARQGGDGGSARPLLSWWAGRGGHQGGAEQCPVGALPRFQLWATYTLPRPALSKDFAPSPGGYGKVGVGKEHSGGLRTSGKQAQEKPLGATLPLPPKTPAPCRLFWDWTSGGKCPFRFMMQVKKSTGLRVRGPSSELPALPRGSGLLYLPF